MTDDTIPVAAPDLRAVRRPTSLWSSFDGGESYILRHRDDWTIRRSSTGNWLVCKDGRVLDAYAIRHDAMTRAEALAGVPK